MTKQSHYNVGIYVRLSQEDERAGESISIENQKKMLTEYVSKQTGWNLVEIYEDDGYSGTDFNRPGVQKLLDDARSGKINLILCKDLSRFGRNYIEVGQYVDYVFPSFNIRFIALSDNVDTLERNSTAMDMMPIVNLFNEWHAASTSKKIRAVMVSNAKQGKYHAPVAPFGYLVGDTEDRLPVVDETNAPYVRMMYKMRSEGASSGMPQWCVIFSKIPFTRAVLSIRNTPLFPTKITKGISEILMNGSSLKMPLSLSWTRNYGIRCRRSTSRAVTARSQKAE